MPTRKTLQRARRDKREGKSPSTQAGEFVREEMDPIREGKHGARSPRQAIAIGLSNARRAGVELKPPSDEQASAPPRALAVHARAAATRRSRAERSAAAKRAARAKGHARRAAAARKAARTRASLRRS